MTPVTVSPSIYEAVFSHVPFPALVLDGRNRILDANRAVCAVLRASLEDLRGRDVSEIIHADDPTWCSANPVDQLGTPSTGRKLKARIRGKPRLLRVGVVPLGEGSGEGCRMVTVRDAGPRERDSREEQEQGTSLQELCACVAHEIRNPLTGIRTTVQFVGSKLPEEDPRREDLSDVLTEMDRIEQIIADLLLFGRPAEFVKTRGDLNGLLGRILDSMEAQCREAEVEVRRNFLADFPEFEFSPDNIQQVVLNLVRNALEAMPEGGRLKVTTTVRRSRKGKAPVAEIFVSDTGHGIPEDLLTDIFRPFFTTRHNGTGLGLPISLGIVRAHGGRMTARNRIKGGATFRVSLPMAPEEAPAS